MSKHNFRSFNRPPRTPTSARDSMGRFLRVGDIVLFPHRTGGATWKVAEIIPEIHPQAPPNTVRVQFVSEFREFVTAGNGIAGAVLCVPQEDTEPEATHNNEEPDAPKVSID